MQTDRLNGSFQRVQLPRHNFALVLLYGHDSLPYLAPRQRPRAPSAALVSRPLGHLLQRLLDPFHSPNDRLLRLAARVPSHGRKHVSMTNFYHSVLC